MGKIQDWRQTNFMPFCKGEVRSQRVSQFDANIVKYTKQIVEQQVYKHLKDVKVIKKNKNKKNHKKGMETNVHRNEGSVSLFLFFFLAKVQSDRKTGIISDFETTISFAIAVWSFKALSTGGCILVPQISAMFDIPCIRWHLAFLIVEEESRASCWEVITFLVHNCFWDGGSKDF